MNSEKNLKKKSAKEKRYGNFCYDFVKVTGLIPALLWLRPKVYYPYGKQIPQKGVLVCANHVSLLDPIILLSVFIGRRFHSLVTKDLYKNAFMKSFLPRMHCIQIDKENVSMAPIREVIDLLREGRAVMIFPEGRVNTKEGKPLLAFKDGAALMAHSGNAPLLPVYIVQRKKWYQRQRVVVGAPFDPRELVGSTPSMAELSRVSEYLHEREAELRRYFETEVLSRGESAEALLREEEKENL